MALRSTLLYCFLLLLCLDNLKAQNQIIITDDDLQGGNAYTWTSANEYLLDGMVYLEAGGVLTIEPGTVIRGRSGANISNGDFNSALVITQGAQIFAEGTPTQPIIFTAEDDDLLNPADFLPADVGEWGGLLLLGYATIARPGGLGGIDGFNISEERVAYGGTDDTDNSGALRFVSIRHAGGMISPDNEINALTLAGVGSGTTIDYVEVFAAQDDGFEFFGGTVNAYHLVSAYCQDDAFDIDLGYRGIGQFWLGLAAGRRLLEIDGASPDQQPPFSQPNLVNLTLVGGPVDPLATGEPGEIFFRDNSGGHLRNSVVVNALPQGVVIEDRDDTSTGDAYARFIAGDLTITTNYFSNEGGFTDWAEFSQLVNQSEEVLTLTTLATYLENNNELTDVPVIRSSNVENSLLFDPLPSQGSSILTGGTPLMEPGLATVGYQGAFGENDNWLGWTFLKSSPSDFQTISGRVSQSANCTYNESDAPAAGVIVRMETDGTFRFATTDANGEYAAFVPTGTTTVTVLAPGTAWLPCTSTPVSLAATEDATVNLGLEKLNDCAQLRVSIGAPFLRRGFESTYHVRYENIGATTATNPEVGVLLDPVMELLFATRTITRQSGDTLFFALDDLPPLSGSRSFRITVRVPQTATFGQEHCSLAIIRAENTCPGVGGPKFKVTGSCEVDSVRFKVLNIGTDPALEPVPYIVIEDEVMLLEGNFNLGAGESQDFIFPADDATLHFSTLANPNSTVQGRAAATVSCSDAPNTPFNAFPATDTDLDISLDCQPNIGSYDPNDKMGTPAGLTTARIVPKDVNFKYRIRFQNTGTDTAFTVVVVDTLSEHLNPASLVMGNSSHDYTWTLEEESTLKVTFANIMLPDSNVNEPASNGYFYFTIDAQDSLDFGTEIENEADIYFDFNDPIRTNKTFHLVEKLKEKTTSVFSVERPQELLRIYPQPASAEITVELLSGEDLKGDYLLYTSDGRLLGGGKATGSRQRISVERLVPGMYTFVLRDRQRRLMSSQRFIVTK